MKVIAVANQKGGCGKTTVAVNLAAALSRTNNKTLIIDLDPQAHASYHVNTPSGLTTTDIFECILNEQKFPSDQLFQEVSVNLFMIPSGMGLTTLEHALAAQENRLALIRSFILRFCGHFDYIILDCPPNLGFLTLNALAASQYVLIPLMPCDFSLRGMELLKNILVMLRDHTGSAPAPFYVLNQVDARTNFTRQFIQRVQMQLGTLLLKTRIRTNSQLREAASVGKHIFDHNPESRGAEDFFSLGWELFTMTHQNSWTPLFLKARDYRDVYIVGDFNNWQKDERYKLARVGEDTFSINVGLEKGSYRYKFVSDNTWFTDPHNSLTEEDPFGGKNSLLIVQ